ncbi:GTP-dependent dephospho-CoA kinase family protein [Halobacterium wangiae]|uniref:GTP-dependent dephospho-CoA kinase family protein n=1 Tax=Halobacterium wangiae TaxID=2902623 RepID=UPI001E6536CE|nr:GTP-dependent dephospho-CoA kinase family protein [Halobacterium wangiae]
MTRPAATLPPDARGAFKDPLGPVYQDAQRLLADAGDPIIAVGDVVTYHLVAAGAPPKVALVDGKTKREEASEEVRSGVPDADRDVEVASQPATVSEELLAALVEAIDADGSTLVSVVGEEDLATLPAVLAAPTGASVVYGQPNEGMVLVNVDSETKARARELAELLETTEEFWALVD